MHMHAVLYDPETGRIIQVMSGSLQNIEATGMAFVEVPHAQPDELGRMWDETHVVVNGEVVPK